MKVIAKMKNLRIAPRKTKLVADLVRGLDTEEALIQLDHCPKKTATYIKKLILSAMANGENNFGIDKKNMYISEIFVGAGPVLKRWMPKAFGRAGRILKRTSQITVVISEKIEGKGRKSPEQLEKERKARLEEKKKLEKELAELKLKGKLGGIDSIVSNPTDAGRIKIFKGKVAATNMDELKSFGDELRSKIKSGIGLLASELEGKVGLVCVVSDDLLKEKKFSAGKIVGEVAKILGGAGGGRPHLATAGGKDVTKIDEALKQVDDIVRGL